MCKYLFSSGQVPKMSFLEPSFVQYIDSVAYLHFQHIPIYIQKFCKSWNKYIKTQETIYTFSPPWGFLIIQSLYQLIVTFLPSHPPSHPQYKAQRVYNLFFLLAQTFKYRIKLRKLYFLYGTLALLLGVLCTSYGCKENLLFNWEQKSNNSKKNHPNLSLIFI